MDCQTNCGIDEVKIALFGDGNGDKGIILMVREMHAVFTHTNWAVKTILKAFAAIGVITGAVIGLIELFKRIK